MSAIQNVFPKFNSQHCSYHLCQNLYCNKLGMDKETERLFYMAASSISSMDFSEYIEEIKNMNAKVYD